jgi:hypothetical protein
LKVYIKKTIDNDLLIVGVNLDYVLSMWIDTMVKNPTWMGYYSQGGPSWSGLYKYLNIKKIAFLRTAR